MQRRRSRCYDSMRPVIGRWHKFDNLLGWGRCIPQPMSTWNASTCSRVVASEDIERVEGEHERGIGCCPCNSQSAIGASEKSGREDAEIPHSIRTEEKLFLDGRHQTSWLERCHDHLPC